MYTVKETEVQGSPMEVFLFLPEGDGPHPGLVLAMHIPGHAGLEDDRFTLATAQHLADHGYAVAVPFLFHWWPKSESMERKREESNDARIVADMQAAWDLLAGLEGVDRNRMGIMGHCWGGRVAWLAGCHQPAARALAVFYGGNIKKGLGEGSTPPISLAARIPCPVFGVFGNDDTNPSPQDVEDYGNALWAAGVKAEFQLYDGAGHAFQNFAALERYRETASEDAWQKVLDYLQERLGGTAGDESAADI